MYFLNTELKAVAFHHYPSSVMERIFLMEYSQDDNIQNIENQLLELFKESGIKSYKDNKIVFECELNGHKIFYGFYDWVFSIGFSCQTR